MATSRRRFHLGIDYGTSMSKIVYMDYGAPGGERASVVVDKKAFRFSSSVGITEDEIILGSSPSGAQGGGIVWHESVKMRVAGEVRKDIARYCHAPTPELPSGLSADDLAALTVWWLITEGRRAVDASLRKLRNPPEIALGMTLGVPMSFFRNKEIRDVFLGIARAGWYLYRNNGSLRGRTLRIDAAQRLLEHARLAVAQGSIPEEEIRDWIRPEAEAAMWWAFQSPAVPEGPYAKMDVGAGTTNASLFRLVGNPKERLAFFGADSRPVGMDAIDEALARWKGMGAEHALSLRGKEEALFAERGAVGACRERFDEILQALKEAWREHVEKNRASHFELKAWRDAKVFVIGGGSLVSAVRREASRYPMDSVRSLTAVDIECPPDLELEGARPVPREALPFVLVAYGLSNIGLSIPKAETPDEIPPLPRMDQRREQLDHKDIYAR